jgi:hypothetical protein
MAQNAASRKNQSFAIPNYNWWEYFYTIGLKIYDLLGRLSLGKSEYVSKKKQLNYFLLFNKRD